jgi:hypothetical protein
MSDAPLLEVTTRPMRAGPASSPIFRSIHITRVRRAIIYRPSAEGYPRPRAILPGRMDGSAVVEVAIGLAFMDFLLSLLVASARN